MKVLHGQREKSTSFSNMYLYRKDFCELLKYTVGPLYNENQFNTKSDITRSDLEKNSK